MLNDFYFPFSGLIEMKGTRMGKYNSFESFHITTTEQNRASNKKSCPSPKFTFGERKQKGELSSPRSRVEHEKPPQIYDTRKRPPEMKVWRRSRKINILYLKKKESPVKPADKIRLQPSRITKQIAYLGL